MPGYNPKPAKSMREKLPTSVQSVLDMLFPVDDPLGGLSPSPMVSLYKDAAGIPSKALREEATKKTLEYIKQLPQNLQSSWEHVVERYPRISAHLKPLYIPKKSGIDRTTHEASAYTYPLSEGKTRANIAYSKQGASRSGLRAQDTAFHEATHIAQALGNKDYNELYRKASDVAGYFNNPFEQGARMAGGRGVIIESLDPNGRTEG